MNLTPVSTALCVQLLDIGYSHFVIPAEKQIEKVSSSGLEFIFEAVRPTLREDAISILQFMDLPEDAAKKYFIMHQNNTTV
jgi:hypothetical protein